MFVIGDFMTTLLFFCSVEATTFFIVYEIAVILNCIAAISLTKTLYNIAGL